VTERDIGTGGGRHWPGWSGQVGTPAPGLRLPALLPSVGSEAGVAGKRLHERGHRGEL